MDIQLRTKYVEMTPSLRAFLDRRIQPILERYADRIEWARVTLVDVNGPRGGADILCRVVVAAGGKQLVVDALGNDPFESTARAAGRLRLKLATQFSKLQSRRRNARRRIARYMQPA